MSVRVSDHNGKEIEIEAFHPGEFLKEEIEERELLKKDVAKSLNILPHHLLKYLRVKEIYRRC